MGFHFLHHYSLVSWRQLVHGDAQEPLRDKHKGPIFAVCLESVGNRNVRVAADKFQAGSLVLKSLEAHRRDVRPVLIVHAIFFGAKTPFVKSITIGTVFSLVVRPGLNWLVCHF
jgi:hypothetical protein